VTVSEKNTCPAQYGITGPSLGRYEGWSKLFAALRTPGAGLSRTTNRKASSEKSALKPYWGKPAVRNFRGGYGNGGIIRSPLSAITLLD
jgi:hypothetical protein